MKYCSHCGKAMEDNATVCPGCGEGNEPQVYSAPREPKESGLSTAAKVFMIISTVAMGLWIIPLAWCLPMTISYCNKIKRGEPIGVGFKICTLLFVNMIAGVLMLCDADN